MAIDWVMYSGYHQDNSPCCTTLGVRCSFYANSLETRVECTIVGQRHATDLATTVCHCIVDKRRLYCCSHNKSQRHLGGRCNSLDRHVVHQSKGLRTLLLLVKPLEEGMEHCSRLDIECNYYCCLETTPTTQGARGQHGASSSSHSLQYFDYDPPMEPMTVRPNNPQP